MHEPIVNKPASEELQSGNFSTPILLKRLLEMIVMFGSCLVVCHGFGLLHFPF